MGRNLDTHRPSLYPGVTYRIPLFTPPVHPLSFPFAPSRSCPIPPVITNPNLPWFLDLRILPLAAMLEFTRFLPMTRQEVAARGWDTWTWSLSPATRT